MRAKYRSASGEVGVFEHPVVVAQQDEGGGFTLIGFEDWEAVNDSKMKAAVTALVEFELEDGKVGFGS